jgi:hypothetical protein
LPAIGEIIPVLYFPFDDFVGQLASTHRQARGGCLFDLTAQLPHFLVHRFQEADKTF